MSEKLCQRYDFFGCHKLSWTVENMTCHILLKEQWSSRIWRFGTKRDFWSTQFLTQKNTTIYNGLIGILNFKFIYNNIVQLNKQQRSIEYISLINTDAGELWTLYLYWRRVNSLRGVKLLVLVLMPLDRLIILSLDWLIILSGLIDTPRGSIDRLMKFRTFIYLFNQDLK